MDLAANRAITIATAVFVTIIVTTVVFYSISQMQNVYSQVYETDTNIQNMFTEYEEFQNTTKTGIDVINAAKKYRDAEAVRVLLGTTLGSVQINTTSEINNLESRLGSMPGEELYTATFEENSGIVTITFTKK